MTTNSNQYEPPTNNSIIQGAGFAPGGQFATNTTGATGHNDLWRYNNGANTATHMNPQGHTTRPTGHNGFHNNLPNSSDNRNGPTCFKCGEQGHMRMDCRERVFAHTAELQTTTQKHALNRIDFPTSRKVDAVDPFGWSFIFFRSHEVQVRPSD